MKGLLIGLFCAALGIGDGLCQGKVLIVSRDSSFYLNVLPVSKLQSALSAHYKGEIITYAGILPDSLDSYDAIFTDLRFFSGDDSLFIAQELRKLSDFLLTKGKLYIEIRSETIYRWGKEIYNENPLFHELSGSIWFGQTALLIENLNKIIGVEGYFTEGMQIDCKEEFGRQHGYMGVEGDINTVLATNTLIDIAWVHEKEGRKIVYDDPVVTKHYDEFLGRVICNYFGLCEPLDMKEVERHEEEFSVAYNNITNTLVLQGAETFTSIELYNMLGVRLFEHGLNGASFVTLPNRLPPGSYMVVAKGATATASKPIIIWR